MNVPSKGTSSKHEYIHCKFSQSSAKGVGGDSCLVCCGGDQKAGGRVPSDEDRDGWWRLLPVAAELSCGAGLIAVDTSAGWASSGVSSGYSSPVFINKLKSSSSILMLC